MPTPRPVMVSVQVPRCPNEVLTSRQISDITNAVLADNLHTLVTAHSTCLLQQTQVVVSTHNVTD